MRMFSLIPVGMLLGGLMACAADADEDGLTNREERKLGLDKNNADSDGDGLLDGEESEVGLDPLSADTDGDGLVDGEEAGFGSDPLNADTDGDALSDGAERDAGSNPNKEDTDRDGYLDFDEVAEGTDPADKKSRIYKGNWPYYRNKDEIPASGGGDSADEGQRWRRFKMVDQFGEKVDLYDFYNEDNKYIVIDQSAIWCPPCNAMAAYMDGEDLAGYESILPIREAVREGRMYWITVLIEDISYNEPDVEDLQDWYDEYPSKEIPVLGDVEYELAEYMPAPGIPAFALLKPNLKVDTFSSADGFQGLDAAIEIAPRSGKR